MLGRADKEVRGQDKLTHGAEMRNEVGEGLQERAIDCGEANERAEEGEGVQGREGGAVHADACLEKGLPANTTLNASVHRVNATHSNQ